MKVYLAGAIWGVKDPATWRRDVTAQLPEGWEAINPMDLELFVDNEDANPELVVERDLHAIEECDAVLALITQPSWGTAMEVFFAHEMGIPVIGWNPRPDGRPVGPWLRVHTRALTNDFAAVKLFLETLQKDKLKC